MKKNIILFEFLYAKYLKRNFLKRNLASEQNTNNDGSSSKSLFTNIIR